MAITQTGSALTFPALGAGNTGTVSTTITVPADAEIVVVGWSGYAGGEVHYYSTGKMQFTKGGIDTDMTSVAGGDEGGAGTGWHAGLFYLALPDTGSNKTLKWDWAGVNSAGDPAALCSVTFWKGIDTASPVRDTEGGQGVALPYTSRTTINAVSGDLLLAWVSGFVGTLGNEGTIDTWSNLTLLTQVTHSSFADGAWATGSPSGATSFAASTGTWFEDGAIVAISLKPASAVSSTVYAFSTPQAAGQVLVSMIGI